MASWTDFALTAEEGAAVQMLEQRAGGLDWSAAELAQTRARIKQLHLEVQSSSCCYCRRSLQGEFQMVIDVEHILPKHIFRDLMFDPVNLSASCKRCNLGVKRKRWNFVRGRACPDVRALRHDSATYEIIHPNLDCYEDHLLRRAQEVGICRIVKYTVLGNSAKGRFTYRFFELKKLEIESMDRAQGIDVL